MSQTKPSLAEQFIEYVASKKGNILKQLPVISKGGQITQASKQTIASRDKATQMLILLFKNLLESMKSGDELPLNSVWKVREYVELIYRKQKRRYGFFAKLLHAGSISRFDNAYARLINYLNVLARTLYAKQVEKQINEAIEEVKSSLLFSPQVRQRSQLIQQITELKNDLNQRVSELKSFDESLFKELMDFMVCQRARISAINFNFVKIYKEKMASLEKGEWSDSKVKLLSKHFKKAYGQWVEAVSEKIWKSPEDKLSEGEMYGGDLQKSEPYIKLEEKLESNAQQSEVANLLKGHLSLYAGKLMDDIEKIRDQLEILKKQIEDHPAIK